jgi:hypothetical protein
MGASEQYADGFEYGLITMRRPSFTVARCRDNERFVAGSEYVRKGSPTRAFWLGFRRALRGQA